jgi:2'-5' RNA ligase
MTPNFSMPVFRCAIYFAPAPDSPWGLAGSQWLGRCTASGQELALPVIENVSPEQHWQATAEPRRYGWHATLKAPFQLAGAQSCEDVWTALQGVARTHSAFSLPSMNVVEMGSFLALSPARHCPDLHAIAKDCVTRLHPLALALDEAELARRRRAQLTPEQDKLLVQWGYPWVMEQFRFHFTLTGDIRSWPVAQRQATVRAAQAFFDGLPACEFDRLSLFIEAEKGADFQLLAQAQLCG